MVEGLDAIRTFLDLPTERLPGSIGVVFVISCDEEKVARAIRRKWRNDNLPGAVFSLGDARRYLDRIFQFRLEIPRFPKRDLRNFAERKFRKQLPAIVEDLEREEASLESVVTRLMHVGVESPRNAIQIINAFVQSWWVAQKREREGPGSGRPGGLSEGVVTSHPESLAALSVLRVDFPDFYDELEQQPDLIKRFTDVFIRGRDLQEQPEPIRDVLKEYAGEEGGVKDQHKRLLRYISSLQGIRWPRSLRPLLLLTQDPTARGLEEGEIRVREELVSGNQQGVLEALGRDNDGKTFSEREVSVLQGVVEDLHGEDAVRQDNAASVVARISERIPGGGLSRRLFTYLQDRLRRSGSLRYRLGIAAIRESLGKLRSEEKKGVVARLVEDTVKLEGDIDFLTEDLETPSLEEALSIVRSAVSLVLDVREEHGLEPQAERRLLQWLEMRRVAVGEQEDELPFTDLEAWMQKHEESLLPDFGLSYVSLLADYMEAGRAGELELDDALRRSKGVFERMVTRGVESRKKIAPVLTRFVAAEPGAAVRLAYSFVGEHSQDFSKESFNAFIKAFGGRLQKRETEEGWAISSDWEKDVSALLQLVDARTADVSDVAAQEALEDLAITLGEAVSEKKGVEQKARYAAEILDRLLPIAPTQANRAAGRWIGSVLGSLPTRSRKWLGRNVHRLDGERRTELVGQLNGVRNTNVQDEQAAKYREFMAELTEEGATTKEMQGHLKNVYTYLQQNHNQRALVEKVFPALPPLVEYGPKNAAGQMVHQLFSNTQNQRPLHGLLHEHMAEHWPATGDGFANYSPGTYFNHGKQYVTKYPSDEKAPDVLHSMRRMAERGIVGEERHQAVIGAACKLWGHNKPAALRAIEAVDALPPDTNAIANLMEAVNPSEDDQTDDLAAAWGILAKRSSEDQRREVARSILSKPAKGSDERPDLSLGVWIDAAGKGKANLLRQLVLSEEINDEQRKRVWLQIERNARDVEKEFFLDVIPGFFALPNTPQAQKEALSNKSRNEISDLFEDREAQRKLVRALLEALMANGSRELKRQIAGWMQSLEAPSSLIREVDGELGEADQEILEEYFPGALEA